MQCQIMWILHLHPMWVWMSQYTWKPTTSSGFNETDMVPHYSERSFVVQKLNYLGSVSCQERKQELLSLLSSVPIINKYYSIKYLDLKSSKKCNSLKLTKYAQKKIILELSIFKLSWLSLAVSCQWLIFDFGVWGIEPRVLHITGKCSSSEPLPHKVSMPATLLFLRWFKMTRALMGPSGRKYPSSSNNPESWESKYLHYSVSVPPELPNN